MSVEVRIPFARELISEPSLRVNQNVDNLPLDDIATEFGNVSLISKLKVYETGTFLISGGLALRIPTADNVNYSIRLLRDMFLLPPGAPFSFFPLNVNYRGTLENETYNLSPFAAALWTPSDRLFAQGFLKFDLTLNEFGFSLRGTVNTLAGPVTINDIVAELKQQSLMRLNAGGGSWLYRNPCGCFLTGLAALIEVHYTTTLEDADIIRGDVPLFLSQPPLPVDLEVGNRANRNDIVNLTLGSTAEIRKSTTLATGFVIPLREASDKPFDLEFNLQLNHRFFKTPR